MMGENAGSTRRTGSAGGLAASESSPQETDDARATALLGDLRSLIEEARERTAATVNAELVVLYWKVGRRIREDILNHDRAEYGKQIVQTLSRQLTLEFGKSFSRPNLFKMLRFAEVFPDEQIVSTLSRQFGWSHFIEIIPLDDPLQREPCAEMCRGERKLRAGSIR